MYDLVPQRAEIYRPPSGREFVEETTPTAVIYELPGLHPRYEKENPGLE